MKKYLLILPAAALVFAGCSAQKTSDTAMPAGEDSAMMEKTDDTAMMEKTEDTAMMQKEEGVLVGGAMMVPSKDIVDNAVGSKDHTTLVTAVTAAGLAETLKGTGPFTVFAPTNAAFGKLPAGTVEGLVKPEKKADLTKILTYHVVAGRYTSKDLKDGMSLTTVEGSKLTVKMSGGKVMLMDEMGGSSTVTIADVISSNGVTHVVDSVLMPK